MRYIKFLLNKNEQKLSMIETFGKPLVIIKWIEDNLVVIGSDKKHILDCAVRIVVDLNFYQISSIDKNITTGGNIHYNGDMSLIGQNVFDASN